MSEPLKTYAERAGWERFNWNEALSSPPEAGTEECNDLYVKAGTWVTCACGNLCDEIPRDWTGKPRDRALGNLGEKFAYDVGCARWEDARLTLAEIEACSIELLAKMGILPKP